MPRKKDPDKLKLRDMETPMVLGVELDRTTLTPVKRPIRTVAFTPDDSGPMMLVNGPTEPQSEHVLLILRDAATLSSGKLASLTGVSSYTELDSIHAGFVVYILRVGDAGIRWETWVDAWLEYWKISIGRITQ